MSLSSGTFTLHEPTHSWNGHELTVRCSYSCAEHSFVEVFTFFFPGIIHDSNDEALVALTRLLSIAAAPSYYKALNVQTIDINFMTVPAIVTWANELFDHGLREFRFKNSFSLSELPDLTTSQSGNDKRAAPTTSLIERCLVPIGGGKDTATTLGIIANSDVEAIGFSVGDFEPINETARVAEIDLVRVNRTIDPALFVLNNDGAPNGHVPVTAITSTLACIAALCVNADCVAMSNESSADEPTRIIDGLAVNHQWSKTLHAEELLRDALSASGITINYFSLLRGVSEYEIFSLFSTFTQFHDVFTSCNRVFTIDHTKRAASWCGDCDKCRFVYLGLAAFLGREKATASLGHDLFDDDRQVPGFLDLLGQNNQKPFECVGTTRESQLFALKALADESVARTVVGASFLEVWDQNKDIPMSDVVKSSEHIPPKFLTSLRLLQEHNYIDAFRKSVEHMSFGLVGIGRDTAAIAHYLASYGGITRFDVVLPDQSDLSETEFIDLISRFGLTDTAEFFHQRDSVSLESQIVFVSPGVSKYSDDVVSLGDRATTPLAWWLETNKSYFPDTIFIGVTGTKGKSTTASMLNHVLDHSLVAGNLGHAVGNITPAVLIAARYVILEVSSFQASYVTQSPDVVAVTSLFDCHIDWHRSPHQYFSDKLNLASHGASHIFVSDDAVQIFEQENTVSGETPVHVVDSNTNSLRLRNEEMVKSIVGVICPGLDIDEKLSSFEDLKYRHEKVGEVNGVVFISDVLSTAPEAVIATLDDTLEVYKGTVYVLFGGAARDVDHTLFVCHANERSDRTVFITLPETGHDIASHLKNTLYGDELTDGFELAVKNAQPGDVVLLAPGAPSFHRYDNYEKLAEHFEELVTSLKNQ